MLNAGQAGFVHAPVTKVIICAVVLTTVFGSIIESHTRFTLNIDLIVNKYQVWRLVTHNFVFTTPGELLFGIIIIYYFRLFERQLGSSKFSSILLLSSILHTILLILYIQHILPIIEVFPSSGPYGFIFLCFIYFLFEIPKIYHLQLFNSINLSDKTFIYVIYTQFILSYVPHSFISMLSALIAGLICKIPLVLKLCDWPDFIIQFFSTYVLPLLNTNPTHSSLSANARRHRAAARYARVTAAVNGLLEAGNRQQELQRQQVRQQQQQQQQPEQLEHQSNVADPTHVNNATGAGSVASAGSGADPGAGIGGAHSEDTDGEEDMTHMQPSSALMVSVEHVDTLVSMGFDRNESITSLRQAHNDLQTATELLLRSSGT